jgi:arylsulfatase A-like enzyme
VDAHPPFVAPGSAAAGDAAGAYEAAIRFNDRAIGRLRRRLAERGLERDTLLVVTADHGEAFGEHGQTGHGRSVHDEEVRVPLILHWPGRLEHVVDDAPVSLVDVMPTLLAACGVEPAAGMQGRSLLGPGAAPPAVSTRFVYPDDLDLAIGDRSEAHALFDGRFKLIASETDAGRRLALYDLVADPLERDDRAAAEPERAAQLDAALRGFLAEQQAARARYLADHGMPPDPPPARKPTPQLVEQLRSLGYLR